MQNMTRRSLFAMFAATPAIAVASSPAPPPVPDSRKLARAAEEAIIRDAFIFAGVLRPGQVPSADDYAAASALLAQRPTGAHNSRFWLAANLAPIYRVPLAHLPMAVVYSALEQEACRE